MFRRGVAATSTMFHSGTIIHRATILHHATILHRGTMFHRAAMFHRADQTQAVTIHCLPRVNKRDLQHAMYFSTRLRNNTDSTVFHSYPRD